MKAIDLVKKIESWAPKEISWQKDNVGLQIGNLERELKNILLCLEVTPGVIEEALEKNCNFIFSHHPFLFHPLRKIDLSRDKNSLMIEALIKNDITLYSAHTNLDFTKDGVSFEIAKLLGLKNIKFLVNQKANQYKLSLFVPKAHLENVEDAIFKAGGGIIGEYTHCGFRTEGTGSFKGSEKSNPSIGEKQKYETVEEVKLEIIVESWKINKVIKALKAVHPYEEPAYDVYLINNENVNYGLGAVGEFEVPFEENKFLELVSAKLNVKNFRYTKGKSSQIKKVAVCGGSGSEYFQDALSRGADAYITADIKYHTFHDASEEILLVDAGHYETEIHSLDEVKKKMENFINGNNIKVLKYSKTTNPVFYYN